MLSTTINKINYSETPLDDLLSQYAANREDFQQPLEPNPETSENPPDTSPSGHEVQDAAVSSAAAPADVTSELSAEEKKIIKGKREFTAKFLAKNTDRAFAFMNAMIADSDDVEEWKAEPEDLDDIQECYLEMCQSYGWSGLPPWLNLAMCILFTYGPAAKEAFKVRGINKELAAKAARAEADRLIARADADRLKKEKEDHLAAEAAKKTEQPDNNTTPNDTSPQQPNDN